MSHQSDLISEDILAYLAQHERKELLRFLTCGNVDDGKSTLIGRLLAEAGRVPDDEREALLLVLRMDRKRGERHQTDDQSPQNARHSGRPFSSRELA